MILLLLKIMFELVTPHFDLIMFDFISAIVWFFDVVNVFTIVDLFLRLMLPLKGVNVIDLPAVTNF